MSDKKPPPKPPAPAASAPKKPGFLDRLIGGDSEKAKKDPLGLKGALKRREAEAGLAKGGWIKDAIKKPGALRESMGAKKGEPIPAKKLAAAAKQPGKTGQRARLAQTLKGFKK